MFDQVALIYPHLRVSMIVIVISGLAVLVEFVCLTSLDLPTSASVDDRESDHRPRSDGLACA